MNSTKWSVLEGECDDGLDLLKNSFAMPDSFCYCNSNAAHVLPCVPPGLVQSLLMEMGKPEIRLFAVLVHF